jgi:hypothetical protein
VDGDRFWWGVFDIFAFGYREEGTDLADAFGGLDERVAGDAFARCRMALRGGCCGKSFGDGFEGCFWGFLAYYVFEGLWAVRGCGVLGCAVGRCHDFLYSGFCDGGNGRKK